MRRLSLTLLAAGAVLAGAGQNAHAQYFNYTTDFETPTGGHVVNATSIDTLSALGINDIVQNAVLAPTGGTTISLYTFATNSNVTTTDPNAGTFNYPYRVAVTIVPSDATGAPLAGYTAMTKYVTGTITNRLTPTINTLTNTYDNLVSTPDGQAEVLNYVFTSAGLSSIPVQLRALPALFDNGGSPVPKPGGAGARLVGTPEPGSLALLFGMGVTGAAFARRRRARA